MKHQKLSEIDQQNRENIVSTFAASVWMHWRSSLTLLDDADVWRINDRLLSVLGNRAKKRHNS